MFIALLNNENDCEGHYEDLQFDDERPCSNIIHIIKKELWFYGCQKVNAIHYRVVSNMVDIKYNGQSRMYKARSFDLDFIKQPFKNLVNTKKDFKYILRRDPSLAMFFDHVDAEKYPEKTNMCLLDFKLKAIRNEHKPYLKYMNNPNSSVQMMACKQNGLNIQYIINPTEEMKLAAINQNAEAIRYISDLTEEMNYKLSNKMDSVFHIYTIQQKK